jgi:hypothetical protein
MQVLIHKTSLVRLEANLRISGIGLGDPVQLLQEGESDIAAFVMLPSRMPFGLGKSRIVRAGYLGNQAKALLWPAFEKDAPLRVRVVEILAAHLAGDGLNRVSISVWGDPADITPSVPKTTIFSRSRINDDPIDDEWLPGAR